MGDGDENIDRFLRAIESIFTDMNPKTFWPLNGGQIDAYFDVDESLDMYYRLNKLRKELSIKEISNLMPPADVIRLFLEHNAIIGLKVAKRLGIADISANERVKYLCFLFDILKEKVKNDPFCLDGKNLLFSESEVSDIIGQSGWIQPSSLDEQRKIASLIVTANNLCYTLFYDVFMAGGFYIHGPYDVSKKFGEGSILLVREFHNLNPKEIWPELKMPYGNLQIIGIYKSLPIKLNFANHPISKTSIADKLIFYKIYLDGQEISFDKVDGLIELFQRISKEQTNKIKAMSDLDKVRKGSEIAFYLFKKLREYSGDSWNPPISVENTIKNFGDKFIEQFRYKELPEISHWKKLFDPRNDYY